MNSTLVIVLVVALLLAIVAIVVLARNNGQPQDSSQSSQDDAVQDIQTKSMAMPIEASDQQELQIMFEEVATLTPEETHSLVEVDDPQLVAQIDATIPAAIQVATSTAAGAAFGQAVNAHNKAVKSGGAIYQVIIPAGATLSDSKAMEGTKRAFYHGKNGISGHANLKEIQPKAVNPNIADSIKLANAVNAAMNIASLVVGQYYMSEINNKISKLETGIDNIAQFQDMEYRSRVMALIASVHRSATFKYETMQNEELRKRELDTLRDRENECAQLLGQANLTIQEMAARHDIDYPTYERLVEETDSWYDYQQTLLRIMEEIAELTYTFSMGAVSRENSYALVDPYSQQAAQAQQQLKAWHGDMASKFEIDLTKTRRKHQGIGGVARAVPGLFNDDLNYAPISTQMKMAINRQIFADEAESRRETSDYYSKDVRIIKKDGKTYYLPAVSE